MTATVAPDLVSGVKRPVTREQAGPAANGCNSSRQCEITGFEPARSRLR